MFKTIIKSLDGMWAQWQAFSEASRINGYMKRTAWEKHMSPHALKVPGYQFHRGRDTMQPKRMDAGSMRHPRVNGYKMDVPKMAVFFRLSDARDHRCDQDTGAPIPD